MIRQTIARISALVFAFTLLSTEGAVAQYFSLGASLGGGTFLAVHAGIHVGNTGDRRESGLTGGRTELELVLGLPRYEIAEDKKAVGLSLGMNLRQTSRKGFSLGVGFRRLVRAPTPDPRGGYHTVIHFPFGWEPYPLPARGFLYFGLGKRLVPVDGRPAADPQWEFFIPWPQLQIYLLHTGGFHYT